MMTQSSIKQFLKGLELKKKKEDLSTKTMSMINFTLTSFLDMLLTCIWDAATRNYSEKTVTSMLVLYLHVNYIFTSKQNSDFLNVR